jgi:hypothetical protein
MNGDSPSAPPPLAGPPSRTPVLYSAFIFPGMGQYMQRRRGMALLYGLSAGVATLLFLVVFTRYFYTITQGLADKLLGQYVPDPDAPPLRSLLMPGVYLLAIYLANVYDAWFAWYKEWLRWKQQQGT